MHAGGGCHQKINPASAVSNQKAPAAMASGDSESRKKMLPNQSHLNLVLSVPRTKGIEDICSISMYTATIEMPPGRLRFPRRGRSQTRY
jgi:hypothetical protein